MEKLDKGNAMQCFGKMVEVVEKDPDSNTQAKIEEENNCKNCSFYPYCCVLADTLEV